jgi:lipopolysaccharide transport system ATP-binding protein
MPIVITADRLGKEYRIGQRPHGSLRESIAGKIKAPLRRWRDAAAGARATADQTIWALREVSFEIEEGAIVGVIGRNGSGKSTLLKILSRITEPTEGSAEVRGRVASLLEVGTGFHPELTGRENVYLNGAILGMRRGEMARKFDEIVEFSEVQAFIDTPVKHYSSGMALRLAFAVAAHLEPEVLLVDEVLAVGDAAFQKKCLGKMGDVARSGRTILFVSHDLTAVQVLCSTAIRLAHGRVQGIGPVNREITAYLADSRLSRTGLDRPLPLTAGAELTRFGFERVPVESGAPASFRVELAASRSIKIEELAVIVHDTLNRRVGVIDYRRPEGAYEVAAGETFTAAAHLSSVPLVEGEYRLGLSFRTEAGHDIVYDIVTADVIAGDRHAYVPYSPSVRGIVAFDYVVDARRAPGALCQPHAISSY